jgi:hypothetical protein
MNLRHRKRLATCHTMIEAAAEKELLSRAGLRGHVHPIEADRAAAGVV